MISIDNLCFAYRKVNVLENVNLQMKSGFIYGVLGKNGTGKSTLLYSVAGLLRPTHGSIDVLGFRPWDRQPNFLQEVFMVPEEFYLPDISISNLVQYYGNFYPKFDENQFHFYLDSFNVPHTQTLQKMSYGQKKKVIISLGLASNVSLLLLDEPSNGLDIISKGQFRKVISKALNEKKCILISSHQVQDLSNLIDHVIILDNTQVILQESLQTIGNKLSFKISNEGSELQAALFYEPVLGGNSLVAINQDGDESNVNLELFYKAIVNNPKGIQYALKD